MKRASLIGVLGLCAAMIPAGALAASAAPAATSTATYHGTAHTVTRTALSRTGLAGLPTVKASRTAAAARGVVIPFRSPNGSFPAQQGAKAQAGKVSSGASVATYTSGTTLASLVHRFNGLSDLVSENLNGFPVTPPDQGLCAGYLPGLKNKAIIEMVNLALRITDVHGTNIETDPLTTVFQDPNAEGDPRCLYDASTKTWFFTEIGFPPGGPNPSLTNTTLDVTVLNKNGVADYQFDTSLGGTCLGDQPKVGYSTKALLVSTDEYCGPTLSNYEGPIVLDISKSQLVALSSSVSEELFGPGIQLAGIPIVGLDPAINTGRSSGWFVNSFAFDAQGNNNEISSSLGLWRLSGDTLAGKLIHSESYAFPVPALSTGNGSVSGNITSEAALNPDDSRLSGPVNVTHNTSGNTFLWTALDAAVAPKGDPTARDGAAWFKLDTGAWKVASQGYVAARGKYLLYPALQRQGGAGEMVFTITSPVINPSSAFTTLGSGTIKTVAAGAGPHLSFAEVLFNQSRWGDFSFTAIDPSGNGVWMATEYIPPAASQDPNDNWGTSVFEVSK